jgi:hypothetical protein
MTDGGLLDERLRCRGCGEVHSHAKIVSLPDGREVGNYSEEHRRYWEANWVLKRYRSKRTRQEYLSRIEELRGFEAKMELRDEMLRIWNWKKGRK